MSFGSPSYTPEEVPEKQYVKTATEATTSARRAQKERAARMKGLRGTPLSRPAESVGGNTVLGA